MKELREAIKRDYAEVVDYIVAVIDPATSNVRHKVVTSLLRAITQSKTRRGGIITITPRDTNLYKFAHLMHECKTMHEFQGRMPVVFSDHLSQYTRQIPYVFGFEWAPEHPELRKAWNSILPPEIPVGKIKKRTSSLALFHQKTDERPSTEGRKSKQPEPRPIVGPTIEIPSNILSLMHEKINSMYEAFETTLKYLESVPERLSSLERDVEATADYAADIRKRLKLHTHDSESGKAQVISVEDV